MANRILLGNRTQDSSGYGLYVSKPGANVLTCDVDDLTFSSLDSTSSPYGARGVHQTVPFSGGVGSTAPDVINDFTLSGSGAVTVSFQDLGDNVFAYVGHPQGAVSLSTNGKKGITFTSTDADSTVATDLGVGGDYTMTIFKRLSGDSLY
jgi:hypothetical protein